MFALCCRAWDFQRIVPVRRHSFLHEKEREVYNEKSRETGRRKKIRAGEE